MPVEVKDVDFKQGIVQAYFSATNVVDDGGDTILPGAYAKSIRERGPESKKPRIKHLYQHDPFYVLGVPHVLREDDRGLYAETKIIDTAWGTDVLKLYENGVITEHSIMFQMPKGKWDFEKNPDGSPNYNRRRIKEVILWEISSVTWGMNQHTPTVGVKSADKYTSIADLKTQMERMETVLRRGNLSSDEICEQLELWLIQAKSTMEALEAGGEPVTKATPIPNDEPQNGEMAAKLIALRDCLRASTL
jgi:HK97 family phage prohead protease